MDILTRMRCPITHPTRLVLPIDEYRRSPHHPKLKKLGKRKTSTLETKSSEAKHIHKFTVPGNTLYVAQIYWSQRVQFGHVKRGERYLPFRAALGLEQDVQTRTFLKGEPLPQDVIAAMKKSGIPI